MNFGVPDFRKFRELCVLLFVLQEIAGIHTTLPNTSFSYNNIVDQVGHSTGQLNWTGPTAKSSNINTHLASMPPFADVTLCEYRRFAARKGPGHETPTKFGPPTPKLTKFCVLWQVS